MEDVERACLEGHRIVALLSLAFGGDVVGASLLSFSAFESIGDDVRLVLICIDDTCYGSRQLGVVSVGKFLFLVGLHRHLLASDGERL